MSISAKEEFLKSLEEIIQDKILITESIANVREEIAHNCWAISVGELYRHIAVEDLEQLLKKVKSDRCKQLDNSPLQIDLVYYSWFDAQASQLRFNIINSNHERLPFGAKVCITDNERDIIQSFLSSHHHEGVPWSELEDITEENDIEEDTIEYTVVVYKELLQKRVK